MRVLTLLFSIHKRTRKKEAKMFNFMKKDSEKTDRDERKSMKGKKSKRKEKLPSGITADYSSFFAQSGGGGGGVELDRGTEEILATANTTTYIDSNGDLVEKIHLTSASIQHTTLAGTGATAIHSDSSETSNHSATNSKVCTLFLLSIPHNIFKYFK